MSRALYLWLAVVLLGSAGCGVQDSSTNGSTGSSIPSLDSLGAGWNALFPGGETTCALGTEYRFFARAGRRDKLLVYLQGGGACWRGDNCDPDSRPTYQRDVDESDNPANRPYGIFDLDNPANPLADYSMVMIPYCTGDVHIGDRVTTYEVEPDDKKVEPYSVTLHHKGYVNAMAVLAWIYANFDGPTEIFVCGSSAGSLPSPFYAQALARRYPDANIAALGDGAAGYRREAVGDTDIFRKWGTLGVVQQLPGYGGLTADTLAFEDLYIVAGTQHPQLRLYQFDTAFDAAQLFYLREAGVERPDLPALLKAARAEISAGVADFAVFTAGGPEHTILNRAALYQYEVGGVLFRDWLAAAVAGDPVSDVDCNSCDRPELHYADEDSRIMERTRELLAEAADWNPRDDGNCDDGAPRSLGCALQTATREVLGRTGWSAALLETRIEVSRRIPDVDGSAVLRDFNNRDSTRFEDVLSVIDAVSERIASHYH